MSDEACKLQLQRLEITQSLHWDRIETNKTDIHDQGVVLDKMIKMLSQIRWIVTGGVGFFILQNVGLIQVIKTIIGL